MFKFTGHLIKGKISGIFNNKDNKVIDHLYVLSLQEHLILFVGLESVTHFMHLKSTGDTREDMMLSLSSAE